MENLITAIEEIPRGKKVFVFDLDGTLAESKMKIDAEMGALLGQLLAKSPVAIIGGAKFEQMISQLPDEVAGNISLLPNLLLLPGDGSSLCVYQNGWRSVYAENLTDGEKKKVVESMGRVFAEMGYDPPAHVGDKTIEDRGGQITFSALGQHAPLSAKEQWLKDNKDVRHKLAAKLKEYLPNMEVRVAGLTSIDVTKRGIDKKYGIVQVEKYLNVAGADVIFFGDAFDPDQNDFPALESGVTCVRVSSIQDTKTFIKAILLS